MKTLETGGNVHLSELANLTALERLEAVYLILSHEEGIDNDLIYARELLESALDQIRARHIQSVAGAALEDPRARMALRRGGAFAVMPHVHCRICGKPFAGDVSTLGAPNGDFRMTKVELIRTRLERAADQCECAPPILQLSWDFLDENAGQFFPMIPRARVNL